MAILQTLSEPTSFRATDDLADYLLMGNDADRKGRAREAATDQATIEHYLAEGRYGAEVGGRVRAYAHSDEIFSGDDPRGWASEMTDVRRQFGKDSGRRYYHFVISPDPRDHCGVGEVRDVAAEWAERVYPGFQWVVVVHDDNENHIPHAHVVVNSVNPDTGAKVHRTQHDIDEEDRACQEICREHHLSALDDISEWHAKLRMAAAERRAATKVWDRQGAVERAMRRDGRRSWVAETKEAVLVAGEGATTWDGFVGHMREMGFDVCEGRRGVVFRHPDAETDHDHRVLGESLGADYVRDAIEERMATDFGGLLGTGPASKAAETRAPRRPADPHAGVRKARPLDRALLRRTPDVAERRPRTLADEMEANLTHASAMQRHLATTMEAISTIRSEGLGSRSQLTARRASLAAEVGRLDDEIRRAERGITRCMGVKGRAEEVAGLRERLAAMPMGVWGVGRRAERDGLERAIAEGEAWCEGELSTAAGWLEAEGYADQPLMAQVNHLELELMRRADELGPQADGTRTRLKAVEKAIRVIGTGPMTREEFARDIDRKLEMRMARRVGTTPGTGPMTREEFARDIDAKLEARRSRRVGTTLATRPGAPDARALAEVLGKGPTRGERAARAARDARLQQMADERRVDRLVSLSSEAPAAPSPRVVPVRASRGRGTSR
jgi:hypothetical protein